MKNDLSALLAATRSSLRLRLLLGTLLSIVLAIAVAGWALSGLFRQHVTQQFHAELRLHLDYLMSHLYVGGDGRPALSGEQSDPRFEKPYSGLYWQIERTDRREEMSRKLLRSRSLWEVALSVDYIMPADGEVHNHRLTGPGGAMLGAVERVVTVEDEEGRPGGTFLVIVAADERQVAEPVENFSGMLWLFLGLFGLGLSVVAVLQVWIALVPLRRLRLALASVRAGQTPRLVGDFPGEMRPLVEEFNTVLGQNAEVVERARTQAGNLAHALKTPLSVIGNAAQGLPGEAAQLLAAQVEIARRQIDYHLRRSRAAAAVRLPGVRCMVTPVLDGLVRVMQRVYAERAIEFVVPSETTVCFRGEEQDLQEMLGNLLDNAGKWAARTVWVNLAFQGGVVLVTIDDDGPGIDSDARERVLARGERADESVPGSGLGLSIVDDLARLYGGRLVLDDSPRGGLRVRLELPRAE